jgi:hypothetical protein
MTGADCDALTPAELIAALRVGVDHRAESVAYQVVYETWLTRECWLIDGEALPLLVGVDPLQWSAHIERHSLARASRSALHTLVAEFECAPTAALEPQRIAQWARRHDIELPAPFARVLEFLQRVLPAPQQTIVAGADAATASDRELVLGAALALLSRFPAACRSANGKLSSDTLAALILAQAPEWFPLGPPALGHDDIVALLERYLA